jgi:hypothetical protein
MAEQPTVEERLAALERAVADLQGRLDSATPPANWLEKVIGSVTDHEAFAEALEYGRAFRAADRPPDEPGEQP